MWKTWSVFLLRPAICPTYTSPVIIIDVTLVQCSADLLLNVGRKLVDVVNEVQVIFAFNLQILDLRRSDTSPVVYELEA